jgi:hypothetical protein
MLGKVKLDHGNVRAGIDEHHGGDSIQRARKLYVKQRALGTELIDAEFREPEDEMLCHGLSALESEAFVSRDPQYERHATIVGHADKLHLAGDNPLAPHP